ncbi:transposase [Nonomuraea sp. NPDC050536]|uniref:transposase n=1 Tax=Nonomuraea sp. NPDC050536 TaxID=3364366 RepID=UPI0037C7D9B4
MDAAHAQLRGAPIVVVCDNDRHHLSRPMRAAIEARPWLTAFQLPAYAPELNPAEGVRPVLKRGLANLATHDTDQLAAMVKTKLIQCDRVAGARANGKDWWFSQKHKAFGGNVQFLSAPDGTPLWVSKVEPGSVLDITAARLHALPALYKAAAAFPPSRTRATEPHRLARSSQGSADEG